MPKLRVHNFTMSLDGYCAGRDQSVDDPLGVGGESLHGWMFETEGGRKMIGESGGSTGRDNEYFHAFNENIGATIMGRNMFGPIRGEWPDNEWKGWWGPNPPYHDDTFVLTHYARASIPMEGGTTFHFVTGGIEEALERALDAAAGKDVRLSGGVSTIQQYMRAGLVDELHIPISPILLGDGERLLEPGVADKYVVAGHETTGVLHVRLARR